MYKREISVRNINIRLFHTRTKNKKNSKMERWAGKVAVVTGASSGIGAAICESLIKQGLQVVGLARRVDRVQELGKRLGTKKLHAVHCDVTKESDIIDAFKWTCKNVGPSSILVNNAGILTDTTLIDGDVAKWRKVIDTNVIGLCIATREAVRIMTDNKIDGQIIHINSICGHSHIYANGINVYGASKHAVSNLTEVLRKELIEKGSKIKISSLSPGIVQTEIFDNSSQEVQKWPSGESLKSEDIAAGVVYILGTPKNVNVYELTIKPVGEWL